jgi:hypothetical protein
MNTQLFTLITAFALACVADDLTCMKAAKFDLEHAGYIDMGYVGAPVFVKNNQVVAQLTFNMTKAGDYRKREPFTITGC